MSAAKRLFVGGPAHGQIIAIPSDRNSYVIVASAPADAFAAEAEATMGEQRTDYPPIYTEHTYTRRRFATLSGVCPVMVLGAPSVETVLDAFALAAGLVAPR